ncbi:MAG: hypothetical protein GU352_00460 [Acidilobus sp.]|nr:hypothetical protein [Acidilobus sp.]
MGVVLDTFKDALSLMNDEDRRRKATEALERVEELYYDGRTTVTSEDAFFMALGVVLYYVVPVWPRDVGNLARALGVDLERIGWYL